MSNNLKQEAQQSSIALQDYLELQYKDMFEHLKENGVPTQQARDMLVEIDKQNEVYMKNSGPFNIQMTIPLDKLEEHCNWGNLTDKAKNELLYKLGMDTRKKRSYTEKRRIFEGNKQVIKDVVYGEERTDKEWIESPYSTSTAKDYYWFNRQGRGAMFS